MSNVALFGGSFNPPHLGHTAFVQAIASEVSFDQVWVLPCANHAFGKELAAFEHRYRMCTLAFSPLSQKIQIRDDELYVGGNGYTIELIEHLLQQYTSHAFALILGADNYAVRNKWKDFERIESLVKVVFYGRKGWHDANEKLSVDAPFPDISSTEIRKLAAAGQSLSGLVPPAVERYIAEKGIY